MDGMGAGGVARGGGVGSWRSGQRGVGWGTDGVARGGGAGLTEWSKGRGGLTEWP